MKYSDVNLTEHVQELCAKHDKMLMKEIKKNLIPGL